MSVLTQWSSFSKVSSDSLFVSFDKIIEPALKSLSTGALDGSAVLYLMNTAFILGYLDSISKLRSLSLGYDRHWLLADDVPEWCIMQYEELIEDHDQSVHHTASLFILDCAFSESYCTSAATDSHTGSSRCVQCTVLSQQGHLSKIA